MQANQFRKSTDVRGAECALLDARLSRAESPSCIILDFDETLWLRNSTELYLANLRPRFLAVPILLLIDILRPWIFLPGNRKRHVYRDWIRVVVTSLILPWSLALWRGRAPGLAARWTNFELLEMVRLQRRPLYVATFGFHAIVGPLLRHIEPAAKLCVFADFWSGHRVRRVGKKSLIQCSIGKEALERSVVVTDSADDTDLLDACGTPILIRWSEARYEAALANIYVPFMYTQRGKRPGSNYMVFGVLVEDVACLCFALVWTMPSPIVGVFAILLLHLSFWAVYEIGYVENDLAAIKFEREPKIPSGAALYGARMKPKLAWAAAFVMAVPALSCLIVCDRGSLEFGNITISAPMTFAVAFIFWGLYLAVTRLSFWIYNGLDVNSRSVWYLLLQVFRTTGYLLLLRTDVVGALLLASLAVARWIPYVCYRYTGIHWRETYHLLMLIIFCFLVSTVLLADQREVLWSQFSIATLFLVARARRPLYRLLKQARLKRIGDLGSAVEELKRAEGS
jgi:hypothetical protein